jgi:hypothetical protein
MPIIESEIQRTKSVWFIAGEATNTMPQSNYLLASRVSWRVQEDSFFGRGNLSGRSIWY